MEYREVASDAFEIVGLEAPASNDDPSPIGRLWAAFAGTGAAERIPGRLDGDLYAVYHSYEGDHTKPYVFLLGCRVAAGTPAPEGMVRRVVPAGRYARFDARGEQPAALIAAWQGIWGLDLPRRFDVDYERHPGDDPSAVEIHVAVGKGGGA